MSFNKDQINSLYMEMRNRGITQKEVSKFIGLSEAAVSLFFTHKLKLSEHNQQAIKEYIINK